MQRLVQAVEEARRGRAPYVVGITGSVAAGKTTIAERLAELLPVDVVIVNTDGFLLPNAVLDAAGLSLRKGFAESFDLDRLRAFLGDLRAGREARVPRYSHLLYDIVEGEEVPVEPAPVVLLEGVAAGDVADSTDITVFVDADEDDLARWYTDRFVDLAAEGRRDPTSFFAGFGGLDEDAERALAAAVWQGVNLPNLHEHVAPAREIADIVVRKGSDHRIISVEVRAFR